MITPVSFCPPLCWRVSGGVNAVKGNRAVITVYQWPNWHSLIRITSYRCSHEATAGISRSGVTRHEPDFLNLLSRALLHFDNDLKFTLDAKNLFYTYLSAMRLESSGEQGRTGSPGHRYREYAILSIVAVVSFGYKQRDTLI
jgi:hypothetical protein